MERVFGRGVDPYGYASHPHELKKQAAVEARLNRHYGTALEIGCAEGAFTRRLARHCDHVLGIDLSEKALTTASQNLGALDNVSLVRANVRECRLAPRWDLVVVSEVLYYLHKSRWTDGGFGVFLARLGGLLAPEGRMIVVHSFGADAELALRRDYVRRILAGNDLLLLEEVVGGDDPGKASYLLSVLDRR